MELLEYSVAMVGPDGGTSEVQGFRGGAWKCPLLRPKDGSDIEKVGKQCYFSPRSFSQVPAGVFCRQLRGVLDPALGWTEAQLSPCLPGKQPLPTGGEGKWWMLRHPAALLLAQA